MRKEIMFAGLICLVLSSCFSSGNKEGDKNTLTTGVNPEVQAIDSTQLYVNLSEVDSVKIIFTDNEADNKFINEEEWGKLVELIQTAQYDTVWNNKDIMIKMVAPDYTLVIGYKNQSSDQDEWLMLWKDSGKVKFKNTWFVLEEEVTRELTGLFENYRK